MNHALEGARQTMTDRQILGMTFVIMLAMGVLSAALGPALDDLAEQTGSSLDMLGAIFTASFGGTMLAQASGGPLNDRFGQRPVMLAGVVLGAVGALGIVLSQTLWLTLASAVIFGMGFGALDVSSNVLIAEVFAARSVPILNLLHVFFGVGSVIGPGIASVTISLWDTALPSLWVGMAVILLPLFGILRLKAGPVRAKGELAPVDVFSYRAPLLWALGVLMMLYVAIEAGLGAWTKTYADRSTSLSEEAAALLTSGFWFALTIGRVAGAVWGGRFQAFTVLGASLVGMLAGAVVLLVGHGNIALTVLAVLIIGVWAGPPFPTAIAIATRLFRSGPGKATGMVVSLASLGAAIFPWLQGVVLEQGGTGAYAVFIGGLTLAMVVLYAEIRRRMAKVPA
ncbi:MAG: MFS transporter, partial [Chloroflexi bacterium]